MYSDFSILRLDIKVRFMFISCDGGTEDNTELSNVRLNSKNEEGKRDEEPSTNSNSCSQDEEETEEGKLQFPDTEIKIEHVRGNQ
jgi:hypothetical protein